MAEVLNLSGSEPLFKDDDLLLPVLENDPFLRQYDPMSGQATNNSNQLLLS